MATLDVTVPDIGDFEDVEVIEILVAKGDTVAVDDPLITLESDKASMDIPAPQAGTVQELSVNVGDKVSQGSLVLRLQSSEKELDDKQRSAQESGADKSSKQVEQAPNPAESAEQAPVTDKKNKPSEQTTPNPQPISTAEQRPPPPTAEIDQAAFIKVHASPSIRRFARELGVDLSQVGGSGRKGRITKEDVQQFVKQQLSGQAPVSGKVATSGAGIPPIPAVDFSQFGEIEEQPLSRIQKISGPHLHRAWLNVPMVTQHDEADVTELEAFRKSLKAEAEQRGVRVTALVFIMKAVAAALREFPKFNSSLASDGQSLIYKKYYHLGIAVDTPNGLVVPVFRDVDQKSIFDLSAELADVSKRARDGKLSPKDLQGGCFSISSLGGIGGTAFTPIVNAPEVAILGVSRSKMQPVWDGKEFIPRLMLPLDISYDHRVIDGAEGARFMVFLCQQLTDIRRLLL